MATISNYFIHIHITLVPLPVCHTTSGNKHRVCFQYFIGIPAQSGLIFPLTIFLHRDWLKRRLFLNKQCPDDFFRHFINVLGNFEIFNTSLGLRSIIGITGTFTSPIVSFSILYPYQAFRVAKLVISAKEYLFYH